MLRGEVKVNPDKSISHRAFIFSSLACGVSEIRNPNRGDDVMSTIKILTAMDIKIEEEAFKFKVRGRGLYFREPDEILYAGNSGTTARLMLAVLSAQKFVSVITGDESLRKRPMARVIEPLKVMGARIWAVDGKLPALVEGTEELKGGSFEIPVASAQVKTALLIAGLYSDKGVFVKEPSKSRDHTERMLPAFGVEVKEEHGFLRTRKSELRPVSIEIPGDFSSASFIIAGALICPGSKVVIKDVGVNPTRIGFLEALLGMGAKISLENRRESCGEPVADIAVEYSHLEGGEFKGEIIPRMIDEIPLLGVIGAFADGEVIVRDAKELRVKESDRISAVVRNLKAFRVEVEEYEDGFRVRGNSKGYEGAKVKSFGDHRIAMAFYIMGLACEGKTDIENFDCYKVSFPEFESTIRSLI